MIITICCNIQLHSWHRLDYWQWCGCYWWFRD